MPTRNAQVSFLAVVCLLFSGCGGGSGSGNNGGGGGDNNPTTVTVTFSGATPAAVATQIGSGTFAAAAVSSNTLTLTVPSGTKNYAVAYVCPTQTSGQYSSTSQYVVEATTDDGTSFNGFCDILLPSAGQTGTLTMSLDASAIEPAPSASNSPQPYFEVIAQNGSGVASTEPFGSIVSNATLAAPEGSDRVDVVAYAWNQVGIESEQYMIGFKSFTGVGVPGALNGGSAAIFGTADEAIPESITYNGVPNAYTPGYSLVEVAPAGTQDGYYLANISASAEYQALPADLAQAGDVYYLAANSYNVATSTYTFDEGIGVVKRFSGEAPVSVTFPQPWSYTGPTAADLPTFNISYAGFAGQSGVSDTGSINWTPPGLAGDHYSYQVTVSSSYLNGSTSLTMPNLTSITGFIPQVASGSTVDWYASASQSDSGVLDPLPVNSTVHLVFSQGQFTAP